MQTRLLVAAVLATTMQATLATDNAYWENVEASFARQMPVQDAATSEPAWASADGSFERMLAHEPYAGPVAATVVLGSKDPVEERLHELARGFSPRPELLAEKRD
ncbi:MAG TPA: hypothetical protein VF876_01385 [Burkholderiales bacterium]